MSCGTSNNTATAGDRLQQALLEHNPRVLSLTELRPIRDELVRLQADSETADTIASASIVIERLTAHQTQALTNAALNNVGVVEAGAKGDLNNAILSGSLSALRDTIADLSSTASGRHAALAAVIEHSLDACRRRDYVLRARGKVFDLSRRSLVMGVLNVTPDSFSDGGRYFDSSAAAERGLAMREEGADIIDVGGESTRPGAAPVPADEQLRRILPLVRLLSEGGAVVSVDTSSAVVAREALEAGAAIVNDVTAMRGDADMASLVASRGVPIVLMHMLGTPMTMAVNPRYDDLMSEVTRFLRERVDGAVTAGIDEEHILVDPGIGFGKTAEHNLEIMRRLAELRSIGRPILIGTSRKSFIGHALDLPVGERLLGTAATLALAVRAGASVVRAHDVREAVQVVRMVEAVMR
jgi:dihydropteroate synthase